MNLELTLNRIDFWFGYSTTNLSYLFLSFLVSDCHFHCLICLSVLTVVTVLGYFLYMILFSWNFSKLKPNFKQHWISKIMASELVWTCDGTYFFCSTLTIHKCSLTEQWTVRPFCSGRIMLLSCFLFFLPCAISSLLYCRELVYLHPSIASVLKIVQRWRNLVQSSATILRV